MNSPPDATSLAVLQTRFAASLRGGTDADEAARAMSACIADDGLEPERRLRIYRNNVRASFEGALARTYPALKRKIGEEAFGRLAREYRTAHPSRSGDLHWVGEAFPEWLAGHGTDDDVGGLADLARLEWACEETLVAAVDGALDRAALAGVPAEELADASLGLQPGLRIVSSTYPVWSTWRTLLEGHASQPPGVTASGEHVVVACTDERLTLRSVPREQAEFVRALSCGATLGDAIDVSEMPVDALPDVLGWLFGDGLVVSLTSPALASLDGGA